MFEPDLRHYGWGLELTEAARQGADAVRAVARRARSSMTDEEADAVGVEICTLFELRLDPPGRLGALAAAAAMFAGPQTVAAAGRALRGDVSEWKAKRGLEVLTRQTTVPSAIQLLLCSRQASDVSVLERSRAAYRGYPRALAQLLNTGDACVPEEDLHDYLSLELERAMTHGTRFTFGELDAALRTPARPVLDRIVWAHYDTRRTLGVFVVDPDGHGVVDRAYESVNIHPESRIGVFHPADASREFREDWGTSLAEFEIVSPFPQLDRECLTDAGELPYATLDVVVDHWDLVRFLYQRGWERNAESRDFTLAIGGSVLVLETRLEPAADARRLLGLNLVRRAIGRLQADVVYSEAVAASVALIDEFAPDILGT